MSNGNSCTSIGHGTFCTIGFETKTEPSLYTWKSMSGMMSQVSIDSYTMLSGPQISLLLPPPRNVTKPMPPHWSGFHASRGSFQ